MKGWKALGNKLSDQKLLGVKELESTGPEPAQKEAADVKYHAGDSIDFNVEKDGQGKLFGGEAR